MRKIASLPRPPVPTPSSSADAQSEKIAEAIKLLLNTLSVQEQRRVLDSVTKAIQPIPAPHAGEVLGAVVRLLPQRDSWRVREIKEEIAAQGVEATPKELYNALGYLTRRGHLRRVGYGRYLFEGGELVTADDFGGAPIRHED